MSKKVFIPLIILFNLFFIVGIAGCVLYAIGNQRAKSEVSMAVYQDKAKTKINDDNTISVTLVNLSYNKYENLNIVLMVGVTYGAEEHIISIAEKETVKIKFDSTLSEMAEKIDVAYRTEGGSFTKLNPLPTDVRDNPWMIMSAFLIGGIGIALIFGIYILVLIYYYKRSKE